jgi:hypothetical protein
MSSIILVSDHNKRFLSFYSAFRSPYTSLLISLNERTGGNAMLAVLGLATILDFLTDPLEFCSGLRLGLYSKVFSRPPSHN